MLDVYDASLNYVGTEERNEAHRKGMWHKVFYCWIVHDGKLVVQLRSRNKATNPGLLDVSSAGHISTGESVEDGVREVREELGLNINVSDLMYVGCSVSVSDKKNKTIVPYHNREFCYVYMLNSKVPLSNYKLQAEELEGVFEIDFDEGRRLFSGKVCEIVVGGYILIDGKLIADSRKVSICDFTKYADFWLKAFNLAEDFVNERKYLRV